jgi:tripartite-type tricarboxylate transporter receptor subunit TctC
VPALSEFQPGFEANVWVGIAAPRGTLAEIVQKLNTEINAGLDDPKIAGRMRDLGAQVVKGTPAELDEAVARQTEQWAKVIHAANIKAD